ILRFDVTVNDRDRLVVKVLKSIEKLIGPLQHTIDLENRAAFDHVRKVLARNIFHDKKLAVLFEEMVADPRKRCMLETVQQTGLTLDRLAVIVVHQKRLLYGDCAAKSFVSGDIDGTHSALPDLFVDAVTLL